MSSRKPCLSDLALSRSDKRMQSRWKNLEWSLHDLRPHQHLDLPVCDVLPVWSQLLALLTDSSTQRTPQSFPSESEPQEQDLRILFIESGKTGEGSLSKPPHGWPVHAVCSTHPDILRMPLPACLPRMGTGFWDRDFSIQHGGALIRATNVLEVFCCSCCFVPAL